MKVLVYIAAAAMALMLLAVLHIYTPVGNSVVVSAVAGIAAGMAARWLADWTVL